MSAIRYVYIYIYIICIYNIYYIYIYYINTFTSNLSLTPTFRALKKLYDCRQQAVVDAFKVRSMLDCACGDATWLWGSETTSVFACQIKISTAGWFFCPTKNIQKLKVSLGMIKKISTNKTIDSKVSFISGIFEAEAARKSLPFLHFFLSTNMCRSLFY